MAGLVGDLGFFYIRVANVGVDQLKTHANSRRKLENIKNVS